MQSPVLPDYNLKEHSFYALSLVNVYLLLLENEMLPGYHQPPFLKRIDVRVLLARMEAANAEPHFGDEDIHTLYCVCHLADKLLETSKAEYICGMILQHIPHDHQLKNYSMFKHSVMNGNARFIEPFETDLSVRLPDFHSLKERLSTFSPE